MRREPAEHTCPAHIPARCRSRLPLHRGLQSRGLWTFVHAGSGLSDVRPTTASRGLAGAGLRHPHGLLAVRVPPWLLPGLGRAGDEPPVTFFVECRELFRPSLLRCDDRRTGASALIHYTCRLFLLWKQISNFGSIDSPANLHSAGPPRWRHNMPGQVGTGKDGRLCPRHSPAG